MTFTLTKICKTCGGRRMIRCEKCGSEKIEQKVFGCWKPGMTYKEGKKYFDNPKVIYVCPKCQDLEDGLRKVAKEELGDES